MRSSRGWRRLARQAAAATIGERAAWLTLFAEAAAISDDDRLQAAGADLIGALRQEWGRVDDVGIGATAVDACLLAGSHMLDPQSIVPGAIDELERIVRPRTGPAAGSPVRSATPAALAVPSPTTSSPRQLC